MFYRVSNGGSSEIYARARLGNTYNPPDYNYTLYVDLFVDGVLYETKSLYLGYENGRHGNFTGSGTVTSSVIGS